MKFDPSRYRHHVDGWDLTEDQKLDLMQWVWTAMDSFVDRAFGTSPEQTLLGISRTALPDLSGDGVESMHSAKNHFEHAAQEVANEENA